AAEAGAPAAADFSSGAGRSKELTAVSEDIRYLKTVKPRSWLGRFLEAFGAAGILNGVPFLIFAGVLGATQYKHIENLNPRRARFVKALKTATGRINQARGLVDSDSTQAAA